MVEFAFEDEIVVVALQNTNRDRLRAQAFQDFPGKVDLENYCFFFFLQNTKTMLFWTQFRRSLTEKD